MFLFKRVVRAFVNDNLNYPTNFRDPELKFDSINDIHNLTCTLYGWNFYNPNNVDVFLKFFDKEGGVPPVIGTDTPVLTIQVPANGSVVFFGSDQYIYFNFIMWVVARIGYQDDNDDEPVNGIMAQIQYK